MAARSRRGPTTEHHRYPGGSGRDPTKPPYKPSWQPKPCLQARLARCRCDNRSSKGTALPQSRSVLHLSEPLAGPDHTHDLLDKQTSQIFTYPGALPCFLGHCQWTPCKCLESPLDSTCFEDGLDCQPANPHQPHQPLHLIPEQASTFSDADNQS